MFHMVLRRSVRIAAMSLLVATTFIALPAGRAAGLAAFTCGTVSGGSSTTYGHITAVRVGHGIGFDRFVVQFSSPRVPHFTLTPKSSAVFWLDPSNRRVTLLGSAGLKLVLHPASGVGTYAGPSDLRPAFPQLREARRIGDFEGYASWGLGLHHQACKRVFALSAPTRLVIDVHT
jgi:hypothetical protein